MAETGKLKQQQQTSQTQILAIEERIRGTERMQQRTPAFLARAFKNPLFTEQLLLQCDRNRQQLKGLGRKRRLTATASSENLQLDGVEIGEDTVNLLSTTGKDGGISSGDQKVKAVLDSSDQDFGVISDVFLEGCLDIGIGTQDFGVNSDALLEECLDIGIGEVDRPDVEVEYLAAYPYGCVDVKEVVDELGYLDSET